VRPTTWRLLVAVVAVAFALTWGALTVGESRSGMLPDVPWPSALVLAVFGGAVLVIALALRPRLRRRKGRDPVHPLVSARFAVLALACSRAGALFVGVYGAIVALAVTDLSIDFRRHLAFVSGACVLAAVVLVVAGLVLERELRIPPEPPSNGAEPTP